MAFDGLLITEIFRSLQGETSMSGVPFTFVRLTGCNLRCTYCDTAYAFKGGEKKTLNEILEIVKNHGENRVLITGGEPLIQRNTLKLVRLLDAHGFKVSIETHGEVSIENVPPSARIIMDIKTPSSKMSRGGYAKNLKFLKPIDEIKFVIASTEDYLWAKSVVKNELLGKTKVKEILFSQAQRATNSPGEYPGVELRWLAEQILKDRLPVRLQTQLHKWIWGAEKTGV
jgi:7-carboxy-7-deazaguanine synthase